ncbi:MAG: S26 family signal peptidase [Alphaproteobacteria bacterium]|jgi:conjugal transfer pilin signal peptidase TrbI|nr:S26 family signal peptidase [Candidatus Jidaibacter sp.]
MNKPLILFMTPTLVLCILSAHLSIAINTTDSLKHKVFLVVKDVLPDSYEDYVMFKAPANGLYNDSFLKKVGGLEGDFVWRDGRTYYVNDNPIGKAKQQSKKGEPAEMGSMGVLPEGKYFVYSNHEDSYDSRYKKIDWVDKSDVIGVAYPIF